jgi:DNA repair exonuclease SbcCD ATPase subunit
MSDISIFCPRCRRSLQIPSEFDNVICPGCATVYRVRRRGELINLREFWSDSTDSREENAEAVVESGLAEIDELIEEAESEIEGLRGREQSAPLQRGCAFFGLFMLVMVVIAFFMLAGKEYIGGWLFYASIAAVVLLGLARIRRKLFSAGELAEIRQERLRLEAGLYELQAERERIERLKSELKSGDLNN